MQQEDTQSGLKKLGLFAITWPLFIELLLQMTMGSADTFMLSSVSDQAVAAVGVANQVIYMCIVMFGFVSLGSAVVVAQYLGAKRPIDASRVGAAAITVNLLFGAFISAVIALGGDEILSWFKLSHELRDFAHSYLIIVGGTLFLQSVFFTASSVIRANGLTKEVMYISLGINILNIVGNYLFITGSLGFPEWGVTGVAISTAFSKAIGVILVFVLLARNLPVKPSIQDYIFLKKNDIKQILKIGLPAAGEHLSYESSQMAITVFITLMGTAALATRVYAFNIMSFVFLFGVAIGEGTQIIIGHMVGAGEKDSAYKQLLKSLKWSFIITLVVVSIAALFRKELMDIFTDDAHIIAAGSILILLCVILEPGRTFNLVVISSLRAAGDARFPVIIGILSMWGLSVPLAYWLGIHHDMGLIGVWIAYSIDEWLRGILMYVRWKSRVWERKAIVQA